MTAGGRLARRRFFAALGAGTLSLGLERAAGAAEAAPPPSVLRFIGVYTPHGRAHELWQPGPDFDLTYENCSLSPFDDPATFGRSFRQELAVLDGIDLTAGIATGTVGHDGARVILTGSGANGKNPSLDQYLAVERGLGATTPHSTLVLAVGSNGSERGFNVSYARGATPVPKLVDPARAFDELFGGPLSGASAAELRASRERGKSVLDFLADDLGRLRKRAPASERVKLEQHQAALREIEKRLSPSALLCDAPARPEPARFPKLLAFGGGEPYFQTITELSIDLLARALACDLTRFSTLFLADITRTGLYPELPVDVHNDVAHRYSPRTEKRPGDPESWLRLAVQNRHSYASVARLMQRLDEAGILDDCLLYVSSDMGDPALHSSRSVPTLIAGGCGGKFRLGRYLDFRPREKADGRPNNRILVSIAQAFGVEIDRFGEGSSSTVVGRLEELHAG